jgi:DNA-binding beta-propeller fold protein YncE
VGQQPVGIAISPNGSFLYIANRGSNNFSGFAIDTAGNLTPLANSPYTAGTAPIGVAWDPTGNFLYVVNQNSNDVSGFQIAADGTPAPISGSPWTTGGRGESAIAVDPNGNTVVALNQATNTLTVFTKDSSGVLKAGFPVNTGTAPSGIVISK